MTNTQSKIDLLEEQISKLITENDKLRKENAEIHELKRERAEFLAKEVGLMARIVELEQSAKENAKNTKLRGAELNAKIEQTAKENAELKARVVKLEQKQLQDDEKKITILISLNWMMIP